jgi:protein-tyrosine phosphatase
MEISEEKESGFVDIHTHLVPGVDDGAQSLEDSLRLLRRAQQTGTRLIAVTPHVYPGVQPDGDIEKLLQARDQWIEWAGRECPGIRIVGGAEIHCTHALQDALARFGRRLSLNGGDYFLLEFPFDMLFPGLDELIFMLQRDGWIPVIAHPERNAVIQRNPETLARMVQGGVLAQVNSGSLEGRFGEASRQSAIRLLRANLVHAVASDAHWPEERPADLSGVAVVLNESNLAESDLLLRRNPEHILMNRGIERLSEKTSSMNGNPGWFSRLKRHFQTD